MSKLRNQVSEASQEQLMNDLNRVLTEHNITASLTSLSLSEESCEAPCTWKWEMVKIGNSRVRMRVCSCPQ